MWFYITLHSITLCIVILNHASLYQLTLCCIKSHCSIYVIFYDSLHCLCHCMKLGYLMLTSKLEHLTCIAFWILRNTTLNNQIPLYHIALHVYKTNLRKYTISVNYVKTNYIVLFGTVVNQTPKTILLTWHVIKLL